MSYLESLFKLIVKGMNFLHCYLLLISNLLENGLDDKNSMKLYLRMGSV